ncbi:helix-turn-helix domain-containing protein [Phytomonospora sp. NPDC050363]|uniref:winged helix-turn-helix transcriptional regulator n=1 Tax=Phytomonospora sp. NPDC050363 TaxID=3155642 RepID=UPI0034064A19
MAHQTETHAPGLPPHALAKVNAPAIDCPVEIAMNALSGRWTTLVLRELLGGERGYSQLARALPALSDKVLTERLRHLESTGVVVREVTAGFPVRVSYALTDSGRRLGPVLQGLWDWGSAHRS